MQFTQDIQTIDSMTGVEYHQSWKEAMLNLPKKVGKRIDVIRISDDLLCEKYTVRGVNNGNVLYRLWDVLTITPVKVFTNKHDLLTFLEEEQDSKEWSWADPV